MGNMENLFLTLKKTYCFVFPNFELEGEFENFVMQDDSEKNIVNVLKLKKGNQIPGFFECKERSLENFLKIRENKEAMTLLYKYLVSKEEITFDEFLKTQPDIELQSIFYLFLSNSRNKIENDFMKLNDKVQMIVIKQIIKYKTDENDEYLNDVTQKKKLEEIVDKGISIEAMKLIYTIFFNQKNEEQSLSEDEEEEVLLEEDYLKCNQDIDSEFQSFFYLIISEKREKFKDDFMKLNKKAQIIAIKNIIESKADDYIDKIIELKDFKKLFEKGINIETMVLIYKIFYKDEREISLDEFLNSNKDSETQAIFYLIASKQREKYQDDFLKLNKKAQSLVLKIMLEKDICIGELESFIDKIDLQIIYEFINNNLNASIMNYDVFKLLFQNREIQGFKNLLFKYQERIIDDAPDEEKLILFSHLSNKYRKKEILQRFKGIDLKEAEKYLINDKEEKSKDIKDISSGLSKVTFEERLKFFDKKK